jgi:hypothetical protein
MDISCLFIFVTQKIDDIRCSTELGTSPAAMMDRLVIVSANKTLLLLWAAHIKTLTSLEE